MKLVYSPIDIIFDFDKYDVIELVSENKDYYTKMIFELYEVFEEADGAWICSENNKVIGFDKNVYLINDYYFMYNTGKSRSVSSALVKQIVELAKDAAHIEQSQELVARVEQYGLLLVEDIGYDFEVSADDGFGVEALVKALGLKIFFSADDLVSRLIEFLDVLRDLLGIKIFVLININQFMEPDNLESFFKEAHYHGHKLLLLDSVQCICSVDNRVIIDKDMMVL